MAKHTPDDVGHPGVIQPHGFLIGLTPDWRVACASANFGDHVVNGGASPIGLRLSAVLGEEAVHTMRNRLSLLRDPHGSARLFALHASGTNRPIDVAMHMVGSAIIVEAQPAAGHDGSDPIGLVRSLAMRLDGQDRLDALLEEGARQLRALTGFATVSLFRWVEGAAILAAHCARGDHTPAPAPVTSSLRLIVDADATNVQIEPEGSTRSLDRALLQAAGLQDRAAMGTDKSMARLPIESGALKWGVAVCLDQSSHHLGLERLAAAELFCDLLALRIALLEARS